MRASITSIIVCLFFSYAAQVIAKDSGSKPNILIIYADDLAIQNPDSKIPTPHLDKLAKAACVFQTAIHHLASAPRAAMPY
jgi:arylsulfatase A